MMHGQINIKLRIIIFRQAAKFFLCQFLTFALKHHVFHFCPQILSQSVSFFMFLLQVNEKNNNTKQGI